MTLARSAAKGIPSYSYLNYKTFLKQTPVKHHILKLIELKKSVTRKVSIQQKYLSLFYAYWHNWPLTQNCDNEAWSAGAQGHMPACCHRVPPIAY